MPISVETILVDTPEFQDVQFTETDAGGKVVTVTTVRRYKAGTSQANEAGINSNLETQFTNLAGTWDAGFNGASSAQRETMLRTEVELLRRTVRNLIRLQRDKTDSTGDA
jgi:hypothetical protein